jgi:hypothetical protein
MAHSKEFAIGTHYAYHVALLGSAVNVVYGSREHPGVKTPERLLFAFF